MTGDAGGYAQTTIEIEPVEAAAGATKVVWTPQYGQVTVQVPPGAADGVVIWAQSQAGPVAATIRIRGAEPGAPAGYPAQPGSPAPAGYPAQPGYPAGYPAQPGYPAGYPAQPGYPAGPPAAKPARKGLLIGVGSAVALVLIAGCCIGARLINTGDDEKKASPPGTSTGKTTAAPITAAEYSALLVAADTAIKTDFSKLNTANADTLSAAAPAAAETMRTQAEKLLAVTPPESAKTTNSDLADELKAWADSLEEVADTKSACPASGGPYPQLLSSQFASDIRVAAKDLVTADPTFVFGTFLPAAPKEQNRRLANGTYLKKPSKRGLGHLEIQNGAGDTTISLVPTNGTKPTMTVYVRSKGKFTATGVADGTYWVYSAVGEDFDKAKKGFTRDCGFTKFDDKFKFTTTSTSSTIWRITLTPVAGGNASTSNVDPNAFPTD